MLHFKMNDSGQVVAVAEKVMNDHRGEWLTRHKIVDILHANRIAHEASQLEGTLYIGIDNGASTWPRFDVVQAPKVGDKVSYAFNGDSYPDGEVTHVTANTQRIVKTNTGSTYYRNKNTGSWKKQGGTWSLVQGHEYKQNPSF